MPKPRVLLVDDNDAVRITLKLVLELHGFEVVSASDVNEALGYIGSTVSTKSGCQRCASGKKL